MGKCKNCKREIKQYEGKWWHYKKEKMRIGRTMQTIIFLAEKQYFPDGKRCMKPKVI